MVSYAASTSSFVDINTTTTLTDFYALPAGIEIMMIFKSVIASVGIIANLTVVVVFGNHRKLRRKIPNIFIINQVSKHLKLFISLLSTISTLNGYIYFKPMTWRRGAISGKCRFVF